MVTSFHILRASTEVDPTVSVGSVLDLERHGLPAEIDGPSLRPLPANHPSIPYLNIPGLLDDLGVNHAPVGTGHVCCDCGANGQEIILGVALQGRVSQRGTGKLERRDWTRRRGGGDHPTGKPAVAPGCVSELAGLVRAPAISRPSRV